MQPKARAKISNRRNSRILPIPVTWPTTYVQYVLYIKNYVWLLKTPFSGSLRYNAI